MNRTKQLTSLLLVVLLLNNTKGGDTSFDSNSSIWLGIIVIVTPLTEPNRIATRKVTEEIATRDTERLSYTSIYSIVETNLNLCES